MKRVLLVEDLPPVAEHLKGLLGREKEVQVTGVFAEADAAVKQATTEKPEVVMIDYLLDKKETTGIDVAKRIRTASPGTRIVMVTIPQKPVAARPDAGIDAVFVLPGGANELALALGGEKKRDTGGGSVTAVYSPKGGTGKSFIVVNLASVLRRQGQTVAVFDGVMQFGSIRHFLKVPPETKSIADLPAGGAMRSALPEALWEGPAGVDYLLAPPRPEQADLVSVTDLPNAIGLLAGTHDHVIVDVPGRLGDDTLGILDSAGAILLVVTYSPHAITNARAAIETFDMLGYKGKKPVLAVLNHADESGDMSRGALEHALGIPIAAEIPTDRKRADASVARQEPVVVTDPTSPIGQAFVQLATALVSQKRK